MSPSTDRRPGTWWGTIPSRLSNEWFSIITTTMCSISGMLGVPAGLFGNGSVPGARRPAGWATGRAQAGRPRVASSAAPPAAALSSVRRVKAVGSDDGLGMVAGHYLLMTPNDRDQPGGVARILLIATRVWIPVAIAVAGVVLIVLGHGRTAAAGAGVALVIAAVIVWMINWMYRMSIESNRERDREEEAREYFYRHGRWPDE